MPTRLPRSAVLYRAQLGPAALARGERVVCQWLAWAGADGTLARVRIVSSTVAGLPYGRIGLVPRDRLVPLYRPPHALSARQGGPPPAVSAT